MTEVLQTKCDLCPIHHRAICKHAQSDSIAALGTLSHTKSIPAGQTITAEDEPMDYVGNIISGVVKISKTLEDGRQQVVGLLFASDFFGHPFSDMTRFSYEASSDVKLCVFERKAFEKLVLDHPELEHEILLKVLTELDAAREWIVLLGCQNAREKIASFLLMLLRRVRSTGCTNENAVKNSTVRFPINRKDIAMFLGTTLETISRQLQALSKAGVLKIIDGNTFEVLQPRRLAIIAGHEEWLTDYPI